MLKDKILMITGGTGSFGNAVLHRFLDSDFSEIPIFSPDELKQENMRISINNPKVKFYIGDVRNYHSVFDAMNGVDYVFHAAPLKQVPSCEFYPMEAIRTNCLGPDNVMSAAIAYGVERIVVLRTDKAIYPINAMGMSKAIMERLMVAKAEDMERYYRVPMDGRDLNCNKFFVDGEASVSYADDYTSHNTKRLDFPGVKELLMKLPLVRSALNA